MGLTYQPPLAGLGARFLAVLVDGLIGLVLVAPGSAISYGTLMANPNNPSVVVMAFGGLLSMVLLFAYLAVVFVMWTQGQTPGKRLLGLRVLQLETGQPATFWRMALRDIIGKWLSGAICYLGYIWAFLDANKQGWHDKIAGTIVVKER
jgi:uncharacterized RDD family membrane protein YckC